VVGVESVAEEELPGERVKRAADRAVAAWAKDNAASLRESLRRRGR